MRFFVATQLCTPICSWYNSSRSVDPGSAINRPACRLCMQDVVTPTISIEPDKPPPTWPAPADADISRMDASALGQYVAAHCYRPVGRKITNALLSDITESARWVLRSLGISKRFVAYAEAVQDEEDPRVIEIVGIVRIAALSGMS